jgi:hypothetical protein
MNNWRTIAPIHEYFDKALAASKPFDFDETLSIGSLPDFVKEKDFTKLLSFYQRDILVKRSKLAFIAQYYASSLGDPDPNWHGDSVRSIQDIATEKIILASIALWIAKPTTLIHYGIVIHAEENKGQWLLRQAFSPQTQRIHKNDTNNKLTIDDLNIAKELYQDIIKLDRAGSAWIAVRSIFQALSADSWDIRFLILWIAIEALFGTDTELTYRLSLRLSLFLEGNKNEAIKLYKTIKKIYRDRNKVVHGRGIQGSTATDRGDITYTTEDLLRKSLIRILKDSYLRDIFSTDKREDYLDALAFDQKSYP